MKRSAVILLLLLVLVGPVLGGCQPPQSTSRLNLAGVDPITLDPALSADMLSHRYILQIFGGLARLDDNLVPVPDIAESWEISDDGRTYTFYLRSDVRFHDGSKVTAADFKYSWERAADPETGSRTAATYLGDIVGVARVLAGRAAEISGVNVIDEQTLRVTISRPRSYFLAKMTYPTAFVVDKANVQSGSEWWRRPNGTGPFKLGKWEEENLLALEKNERYYADPARLDSVVFQLWSGLPMNMYETGEIDAAGVSRAYIDKVTDETGPFYPELQIAPELSFSYIGFDHTRPPFDDINVRRAFSQAVDRKKLTSLVYRDMMQPAESILPPGMPGFNENLSGLSYDIEEARRLIAASRYGSVENLPPITITTSGWGGLVSGGLEAIIAEWRRNLGVEVEVRQLEPERFLYHLVEEKDEMFYMGWVADYPHPQNFLEVLFRTGEDNNAGEYSNPDVDSLLEQAGLEPDYPRSLELYRQVEQKLVDDAACIPLWFGRNYYLVKPYVNGYHLNPMGFVRLERVSVNPD